MVNDEKQSSTKMLYVRAKGVFGRYGSIADKYREPDYPVTEYHVESGYASIDRFLKEQGTPLIEQQADILPYLDLGIVSGPNLRAVYLYNDCLVANAFESGNGFNFDGVYHCLIAAAFGEEIIQETFRVLIGQGYNMIDAYWQDNQRFHGQVEVPQRDLLTAFRNQPKLLSANR